MWKTVQKLQPLVPRLERVFETVTADHDDLYLMIAGSRSVVVLQQTGRRRTHAQ